MLTVVTHSGTFHADDVFAYAILKTATVGRLSLLRTRDEQLMQDADVLFDVGGQCDAARHRYDHHMRDKPLRDDGAPYSSAGLVWHDFGAQAILALHADADQADVAKIWRSLDDGLIRDIDLMDNGATTPMPGHVSAVLEAWNPSFVEDGRDENDAFLAAADVATAILQRACARAFAAAKAADLVAAAAATADHPAILVLERRLPWEDAVFDLGLDQVLYVVRPAGRDWTVSAVPPEKGSFGQRLAFPDRWAGLRDVDLAAASGVADATFCHPARFVCGAKSREGAVALARLAVGQAAR